MMVALGRLYHKLHSTREEAPRLEFGVWSADLVVLVVSCEALRSVKCVVCFDVLSCGTLGTFFFLARGTGQR